MTVVKKDLTTSNVVSPGDGVYAEQLNYGASTGGLRSVSDVITRHFEDYNAKFIPNRIYGNSALTQSGLQFTLGGGASVYATVNGRWIKISADESHTVSTTNGTYVVYLTVANASSDEENRNPSNDTVSLTSVLIGSYTDANDKLPLAVVVVSGGAYSSHTDLYDVAGSSQLRASAIRPANGSSINFFGGTYPQDSLVGLFNATRLRLQDDIYLALGTDNDGLLRYSTANYGTAVWNFVGMQWDGSNFEYIYNDSIVASGTDSGLTTTSATLVMGKRHDDTNYLQGNIRNFRIYDRKLEQAEWLELYSGISQFV